MTFGKYVRKNLLDDIEYAILEYSNYKKLLIKYDKDFNDNPIKQYCKTNNIEFDYVVA